jgi:hypothetical protein
MRCMAVLASLAIVGNALVGCTVFRAASALSALGAATIWICRTLAPSVATRLTPASVAGIACTPLPAADSCRIPSCRWYWAQKQPVRAFNFELALENIFGCTVSRP